MFQRKRQLKKEKSKGRIRFIVLGFLLLVVLVLAFELLYFYSPFKKSTYLSPLSKDKVSEVTLLQEKLTKEKISFTNITASSDASLIVRLKEGSVVILSSKKDIESQISSLQLMLARLTIEGKKLKVLDFRYDNPVVSF